MGLIPGGARSHNNRAHANFMPFPPFDNRNLATGRLGGEYNVVIIFKPVELIKKYNLRLSMNAILVTDCPPMDDDRVGLCRPANQLWQIMGSI